MSLASKASVSCSEHGNSRCYDEGLQHLQNRKAGDRVLPAAEAQRAHELLQDLLPKESKQWAVRNAVHIQRQKGQYKMSRVTHYRELQRNYIARLKAEGKYEEFLRRKREWYRRRRQYLPSPDSLKAARRREQDGYITPRRRRKLTKIVDKVVSAL
jgi:hypothetical protein